MFGIVDADNEWMILTDILCETKGYQVVQIELHFRRVNLLGHTGVESHLLHIVGLVGREKHHGDMICVLLLCYTCIDTNDTFN